VLLYSVCYKLMINLSALSFALSAFSFYITGELVYSIRGSLVCYGYADLYTSILEKACFTVLRRAG